MLLISCKILLFYFDFFTYLCDSVIAPETGVVQWRVPVLIHCIDVCLVLQQLQVKFSYDDL